MDSIRGPIASCQIHKERSPNTCPLPRYLRQTVKRCCAVLQLSAAGAKVRGAYLKMSAKKAEIGKRAAERGALATIHY